MDQRILGLVCHRVVGLLHRILVSWGADLVLARVLIHVGLAVGCNRLVVALSTGLLLELLQLLHQVLHLLLENVVLILQDAKLYLIVLLEVGDLFVEGLYLLVPFLLDSLLAAAHFLALAFQAGIFVLQVSIELLLLVKLQLEPF